MRFNYDKIPIALKSVKRWVLWKKRELGVGKTTKVPINAKNGYGAKTNDDETWCDFETAFNNCEKFNCDGLGFMLGNGFFGVDLDNHGQENFNDVANEFISQLDSYTEYSQSGTGIHIICRGVLPVGNRRKGEIEMYDSVRFFALTGNAINCNFSDCTDAIKPLYDKYLKDEFKVSTSYIYKPETTKRELLDNESDVINKILSSKNAQKFSELYYGNWEGSYPSQSEADMALACILAFWCDKDINLMDSIFRSSKLMRDKWDRKQGSSTYGQNTLENAIARCRDTYKPTTDFIFNVETGEIKTNKVYEYNDKGNSERFRDYYGDLFLYNKDNKTYYFYNGKTWVEDREKIIIRSYVDKLIQVLADELAHTTDENLKKVQAKNLAYISNNTGAENMLKSLAHLIPVSNTEFDKDEYILNCENGIVNLKTGELMDHNKNYLCSRNTFINVDMKNEPIRFLRFLDEIFEGDKEVIDFIHCAIGYSITGCNKEQKFFQCVGKGGNGKSILFGCIANILGTYSSNMKIETILAKRSNGGGSASPDIARLCGARFIRTSEPAPNQRLDEGLIKLMTGGEKITSRFLYGNDFEFEFKGKIWIGANDRLEIRGTDDGIWRRNILVEFRKQFTEATADRDLESKLAKEYPQILGWAIKGCLMWQQKGLHAPDRIKNDTNEYRSSQDTIGLFILDKTIPNISGKEKVDDLWVEYKRWAEMNNAYCTTKEKFKTYMNKNYSKKLVGLDLYYVGLIFKQKSTSYFYTGD